MRTTVSPFAVAGELADQFDQGEAVARTAVLLGRAIRCDIVARVDLDMSRGAAIVDTDIDELNFDQTLADRVMITSDSHPAVLSYLTDPHGLSPRRVSDVCAERTWLESRCYRDGFADLPASRQLSIMVSLTDQPRGAGWLFFRSGVDFTSKDLATARELQPALVLSYRLTNRGEPLSSRQGLAVTDARIRLTRREQEVLAALATGASARLIARALCVSERTVQKHAQNAYRKLGSHERVGAINTARENRLI